MVRWKDMKRRGFICGIMLAAFGAAAATGVGEDFSRYSLILDRQPFGSPPSPEALAAEAPVAPQDSFATHVRLTALMQEEGGRVRVGFVDRKQKDKSYMLNVGEKADDYEVLEADVAAEVAKIRKGTEEQWLSMKAAGAQPPPNRPSRPSGVIRPPSGAVQVPAAVLGGLGATNAAARRGTRYAALRRAELEREKMAEEARKLGAFREPPEDDGDDEDEDVVIPATPPPEVEEDDGDDDDGDEVVIDVQAGEDEEEDEEDEDQAIREAEIQQHLQSYQKELIKQGLPPLPIPLTAKTDAELVQEGVLPPITADEDDEDDEE